MIRLMANGGTTYDVVVAGLGAMGSAAVYHLAKRGKRVAGFDRFHPPHTHGSSHGYARVIREAYASGPAYVNLVRRAYALWEMLEDESGTELVKTYGHLSMRPPGGAERHGVLESARAYNIPVERVSAEDVRRRYPMFRVEGGWEGVYEPRAGAVFPEACIDAHLSRAEAAGAELNFDCPVLDWSPDGRGVRVRLQSGVISAGRLVVCAGAWVSRLVADLALPVDIERMTLFFFSRYGTRGCLRPGAAPIIPGCARTVFRSTVSRISAAGSRRRCIADAPGQTRKRSCGRPLRRMKRRYVHWWNDLYPMRRGLRRRATFACTRTFRIPGGSWTAIPSLSRSLSPHRVPDTGSSFLPRSGKSWRICVWVKPMKRIAGCSASRRFWREDRGHDDSGSRLLGQFQR